MPWPSSPNQQPSYRKAPAALSLAVSTAFVVNFVYKTKTIDQLLKQKQKLRQRVVNFTCIIY